MESTETDSKLCQSGVVSYHPISGTHVLTIEEVNRLAEQNNGKINSVHSGMSVNDLKSATKMRLLGHALIYDLPISPVEALRKVKARLNRWNDDFPNENDNFSPESPVSSPPPLNELEPIISSTTTTISMSMPLTTSTNSSAHPTVEAPQISLKQNMHSMDSCERELDSHSSSGLASGDPLSPVTSVCYPEDWLYDGSSSNNNQSTHAAQSSPTSATARLTDLISNGRSLNDICNDSINLSIIGSCSLNSMLNAGREYGNQDDYASSKACNRSSSLSLGESGCRESDSSNMRSSECIALPESSVPAISSDEGQQQPSKTVSTAVTTPSIPNREISNSTLMMMQPPCLDTPRGSSVSLSYHSSGCQPYLMTSYVNSAGYPSYDRFSNSSALNNEIYGEYDALNSITFGGPNAVMKNSNSNSGIKGNSVYSMTHVSNPHYPYRNSNSYPNSNHSGNNNNHQCSNAYSASSYNNNGNRSIPYNAPIQQQQHQQHQQQHQPQQHQQQHHPQQQQQHQPQHHHPQQQPRQQQPSIQQQQQQSIQQQQQQQQPQQRNSGSLSLMSGRVDSQWTQSQPRRGSNSNMRRQMNPLPVTGPFFMSNNRNRSGKANSVLSTSDGMSFDESDSFSRSGSIGMCDRTSYTSGSNVGMYDYRSSGSSGMYPSSDLSMLPSMKINMSNA